MRAVLGSGACVASANSYRKCSLLGVGCAVGREFAPAGAHPGQQRDQKSLSEMNTLAEPAASPSPQPSPQRGEGVKR